MFLQIFWRSFFQIHSVSRFDPFKFTSKITHRSELHLTFASLGLIPPQCQNRAEGQEEIDTSTDHWDLLLVLPACSASESISFEKRRSPFAEKTETRRGISLPSYQTRSPCSLILTLSPSVPLCATGYKSFPNIGLTYRFENSTARKQPICIRIMRNVPRDVRLLDASACLTRRRTPGMPRGEKGVILREVVTRQGKEERSLQRRFRSVKWKFLPMRYYHASLKYGSRNWLMPTQLSILICLWHIKISERACDLSCFRLRSSTRVITWFIIDIGLLKRKRKAGTFVAGTNLNRKEKKILDQFLKICYKNNILNTNINSITKQY